MRRWSLRAVLLVLLLIAAVTAWYSPRIREMIAGWFRETPDEVRWQNPVEPHDVDDDGTVSPGDALTLINRLNQPEAERALAGDPPPYWDVDGDGHLTSRDAIRVVEALDR